VAPENDLRMKIPIALLLALAAAVLAVTVPAQDSSSSVESKIIAMEKAWNQAFKFRDRKALSGILDDSVILVNDDGSLLTKSGFLTIVEKAKSSEDQQVSPESVTVHVHGNVAIATGVFQEKGSENGKPYSRRNRFVDTWIAKDGTWVCVAASATPLTR
jgi:ketosteroid isomerase-like protein